MSAPVTSLPLAEVAGEREDAELVMAIRAGDRTAVDELVSRHLPGVEAVCRSRLRSPHDVNDAVQETFVRALARFAEVRDVDRVGGWLRTIAARVCVDTYRATRRTVPMPTPGAHRADAGRGPEDHAVGGEVATTLHHRLQTLSDRDRRALWLRDGFGYAVPEVAEDLGLTEGSARVLLTRARRRLRATYQGLGVATAGVWLRLRDRLTALSDSGFADLRVVAVAQATLVAALVAAGLPPVPEAGGVPAPPTSAEARTGAMSEPPRPSASATSTPAAASSHHLVEPAPGSPGSATTGGGELRAGPAVVTEETPETAPAARVEADGGGSRLGTALVYAGNLVGGGDGQTEEEPADGSEDDSRAQDDQDDEDDETIRIGRHLLDDLR